MTLEDLLRPGVRYSKDHILDYLSEAQYNIDIMRQRERDSEDSWLNNDREFHDRINQIIWRMRDLCGYDYDNWY
jgi:hypothetical protein